MNNVLKSFLKLLYGRILTEYKKIQAVCIL